MTKDTEEFSQFTESVACREYTSPRGEQSTDPKGWIRVNTKIGPVLEVTTSYLQGEYGVEIHAISSAREVLSGLIFHDAHVASLPFSSLLFSHMGKGEGCRGPFMHKLHGFGKEGAERA